MVLDLDLLQWNCSGYDYVVFNQLNVTNGVRTTYVQTTYNFPTTEVNIILFVATIILLIYGDKLKMLVRSLRSSYTKRKENNSLL